MILSPHHQNRIRNLGMSAVYRIAADEGVAPSDVLDLMVTAPFSAPDSTTSNPSKTRAPGPFKRLESTTPSQPGTSQPHAPAAQTDGSEGLSSSLPTEPSVDLSGLAHHEQGPIHPAVPPAGEAADGQAETLLSKPSVAPPPKAKRKMAYARVKEAFEANPSASVKAISEVAGCHASTASAWVKQMRRERAAKTTEALKESPAKPQEAVEPPPAPEAQPEPEQPPATIPVARALPLPPPVVKPMQKGPQGRFYLKEKTEIGKPSRWVHQSLQPCPTGPGPLMTLDRKWAWYDTMERFKGAVKKWPELKDMRKEAAHA